ncbi:MAG TPA: sigma-70 family RNA polymerase sigma factor [Blastocatellia bacterium]
MSGDSTADDDLVSRYNQGVSIIVDRIVKSRHATEDVSQETFKIVLEKIKRGDVRDPERLSGFVCGIARNTAINYLRGARKTASLEEVLNTEQIPDPAPNQLDEILSRERALLVRRVISELNRERDREVLFRYFIAEEDKDNICRDLNLTRPQFNGVVFRAIARFKELYLRHAVQYTTSEVQLRGGR